MIRRVRVGMAVIYFSIAFLLLITAASNTLAQTHDYSTDLAVEHRFTSLETQLIAMATEVHELKQRGEWDWLKSLAMIVLVGDAGARQLKKRSKLIISPDDNE